MRSSPFLFVFSCFLILTGLGSPIGARAATIAVDGSVFLEGETEHSGVQVDFDRTYPSSLSYSAFSSLTGYYRQELEEGMYDVAYSKTGFLSASFSDQTFYFGDIPLPDVVLEEEGLSGALSGTLETGTYKVDADIEVAQGDSLVIEPGVTLRFKSDCAFTINGYLEAVGTEAERIVFTRFTDGVLWGGIKFSSDADSQSSLSHCLVEYSGQGGITINGCSPTVSFSEVSGNTTTNEFSGAGIGLTESSSLLDNVTVSFNTFTDDSFDVGSTSGILCRWSYPEISNCLISHNASDGRYGGGMFILSSDALVHHTIISDNQARYGGGVRVWNGPENQVLFYNVQISENVGTVSTGGLMTNSDSGRYVNVSVINNQGSAGVVSLYGLGQEFINCIIAGNGGDGFQSTSATTLPSIQYCAAANNVSSNFSGELPEGLGANITTNANGDPCDIYHNIQLDPLFANFTEGDYGLTPGSPCIDAGVNVEVSFLSDLLHNRRIWDGNGDGIPLVDIGPYEYGAPARSPLVSSHHEGFDNFDIGVRPADWTFLGCGDNSDCYPGPPGYFGELQPSIKFDADGDSITTNAFLSPEDVSFWLWGVGTNPSSSLLVEEFYEETWHGVVSVASFPTTEGVVYGPYPLSHSTTELKFTYLQSQGNLAFDDVGIVSLPTLTPIPTPSVTPTPSTSPSSTPSPSAPPTASPAPTGSPTPPTHLIIDQGFDDFQNGVRPSGWTFCCCDQNSDAETSEGNFGRELPSIRISGPGRVIETEAFTISQEEALDFWIRAEGVDVSSTILVEEYYDSGWNRVVEVGQLEVFGRIKGPYGVQASSSRIRFRFMLENGLIYFDDVRLTGAITPVPPPTCTPSPVIVPPTPPLPTPSIVPPAPTPLPPELILTADPTGGRVPLTIDFEATVLYGSEIQYYRWDYNGDGVWDYISPYSAQSSHTYSSTGTYQAICEVEDSLARVARNSVYDIQVTEDVEPLQVEAQADPDSGEAPLEVDLSGIVTPPERVVFYLWDFEDDGIIDYLSLTGASVTHTYGEAGEYQARLSAIDERSLVVSDAVTVTVSANPSPPEAEAQADPQSGTVPLAVDFSGSGTPTEDIVLYEWDFDGDGAFDWGCQTGADVEHTFDLAGSYSSVLRITTDAGLSAKDTVVITVEAPETLKVWVSNPSDGSEISGNSVTVRLNAAPASLISWVQPQYRAQGEETWTDLGDPIIPPPYSFYYSWDTTLLAPGGYELRGKAEDTSEETVHSEPVSVTVAYSGTEIDENTDEYGDRLKTQVVSPEQAVLVEIAGGLSARMPYRGLDQANSVVFEQYGDNPHQGRKGAASANLFDFVSLSLEEEETLLKPIQLVIPYADEDDDGVVDGTGIPEGRLKIFGYNESEQGWQASPSVTVYREENYVQAPVMAFGDYALGAPALGTAPGDYDGDGTSDLAIFRPSNALWKVRGITSAYFGTSLDEPVPRDYDGDGAWDLAYFRSTNGFWKVRGFTSLYFGTSTDAPVPGDYDGDGSAEAAYFRDTNGFWKVRGFTGLYFGTSVDVPIPGDFTGDGAADFAYHRSSNGLWKVRSATAVYFGTSVDTPVPADYDGDGSADLAYFRGTNGLWKVRGLTSAYFGTSDDEPIPGDYDGDSTADFGYRRPAGILWKAKGITRVYFGLSDDSQVTNP